MARLVRLILATAKGGQTLAGHGWPWPTKIMPWLAWVGNVWPRPEKKTLAGYGWSWPTKGIASLVRQCLATGKGGQSLTIFGRGQCRRTMLAMYGLPFGWPWPTMAGQGLAASGRDLFFLRRLPHLFLYTSIASLGRQCLATGSHALHPMARIVA